MMPSITMFRRHIRSNQRHNALRSCKFKYILPNDAKKPILVPISAETLKKFTAKTQFHDFVVDFKGHGFIKGMKSENFTTLRPSYDLCLWTNAIDFLKRYGHAFATALTYSDVVHDIDEGEEFNANIANVKNFVNEMNETGLYSCGIRAANERIKDIQSDLVTEDKVTRENYETWRSGVDTLLHYGIEYKREKDEEVWP